MVNKCQNCDRSHKTEQQLCGSCVTRLVQRLADLPALHKEASYSLQPQKGGSGSHAGEMSIGINITALDFVVGREILNILHEWEKLIRTERKLTPPAMLKKLATTEQEIAASTSFHLTHLDWMISQEFAGDYSKEIAQLHSTGMNAARRTIDPVKRIPCPSPLENDTTCQYRIPITGNDLLEPVTCKKCKTQWTAARLVSVALTDDKLEIWLDADAISQWVGLSEKQVQRISKKHDVPKKGQLYELNAFMRARNN